MPAKRIFKRSVEKVSIVEACEGRQCSCFANEDCCVAHECAFLSVAKNVSANMIEVDERQLALANAFRLASLASLMVRCRSRSVEHDARSKNSVL